MNEKALRWLYEQHKGKLSDKWSSYLLEYDRLFNPYRALPVRLLEIGIQNGGSLEIWAKYFANYEKIVGCDINPDCSRLTYSDSRISVVIGDANTDVVESKITEKNTEFDLIIDDGSHASGDIIRTFARYFGRLSEGGLFVAEDLHCSYWKSFQGGLFDPASSIAFFKRLADVINSEHWGVPKSRKEVLASFMRKYSFEIDDRLLAQIHSVEFINSLCVIRKQSPLANTLGERFMAGTEEDVVPGLRRLHLTSALKASEETNQWSVPELLPEDELAWAGTELARQAAELESLRLTAARSESLNASLCSTAAQSESLNASLRSTVAQRESLNASLRSSLSQCELQSQQLLEKVARLARESDAAKQLLEETRSRLRASESIAAGLQRQAAEILGSTSWRVSAPVRWLGLLRRRKRG